MLVQSIACCQPGACFNLSLKKCEKNALPVLFCSSAMETISFSGQPSFAYIESSLLFGWTLDRSLLTLVQTAAGSAVCVRCGGT